MDLRRLRSFLKIVDTGSLTRAAAALNIAQPALSQQLASLESYFRQKLLIRGPHGVTPTEAGRVLYRHAQALLKQFEQCESDVKRASASLSGNVSVGIAPYSAGSTISLALLKAVREKFPDVLLHIVEGFAVAFSELIMNGKLDMAIMHGAGPMRGVKFQPLIDEEFFLVASPAIKLPGDGRDPIDVAALIDIPLLLPSRVNFVRRAVDTAFSSIHRAPHIVAEVESLDTLREAVADGTGCAILPWSVANQIAIPHRSAVFAIANPRIEDTISIGVSDQMALSEAAVAVRGVLLDLALTAARSGRWQKPVQTAAE
ncbi:nitrogen assimilation transcriptional regulator NAC [Terrarubrum flagellatum]|uniref:nitrogen assimilation transcriptional regulator NAC n=1 Tax=Terrirubrum flagellatum TaxID=2895980 RepID=UPI0031456047